MCGIVGAFSTVEQSGLAATRSREAVMLGASAIEHRGPDGSGLFGDAHLAVGIRRLAVIDLVTGDQPLFNEDRSVMVVCNGEIYNYPSLRRQLESKGHHFSSNSDVEVIAHLYEERGPELCEALEGMFAFCVYDHRSKTGVIGRDAFGVKPLYYAMTSSSLMFASEIRALAAVGGPTAIAEDLSEYLVLQYARGTRTPYSQIQRLEPGAYIAFAANGGIRQPRRYWAIAEPSAVAVDTEDQGTVILDALSKSVEGQLRSDVPVGLYLSGGVDSSVLALLASQHRRIDRAFTVRFDSETHDESEWAKETAARAGIALEVVDCDFESVMQRLPQVVGHLEEPVADTAAIPTMLVAERAKGHVKVLLSGCGADELFGGYTRYRDPWWLTVYSVLPDWLISVGGLPASQEGWPERLSRYRDLEMRKWLRAGRDAWLARIFQFEPERARRLCAASEAARWPPHRRPATDIGLDESNRRMLEDFDGYLPNDLLLLFDKLTMAHSIEGRVPYLDRSLARLAFQISGRAKTASGLKSLFKQWVMKAGILPPEIMRRPKRGFTAPVEAWARRGLIPTAGALLDRRSRDRSKFYAGLRGAALRSWLQSLGAMQVWTLVIFEAWHQLHVDRTLSEEESIAPAA